MKRLLLLFLPLLLLASTTKFYLPLPIESSNGRPIKDATVVLYQNGSPVDTCIWANSGLYYYTDTTVVTPGEYDIYVNGVEYATNVNLGIGLGGTDKFWVRSQIRDSLRVAQDTTSLKLLSGGNGRYAFLRQLSSSKPVGAGWFVVIDSTYPESYGGEAFAHPEAGKQWVRLRFFKTGLVYLTDFGANPNGTTDVSSNLSYALGFLKSIGGGKLVIPVGTFIIDEPQRLDIGNITLVGFGDKSVFYLSPYDTLRFYGNNWRIKNIKFDGRELENTFGLYLEDAENGLVDGITVRNTHHHLLCIHGCTNVKVINSTFTDSSYYSTGDHGIDFDVDNLTDVRNNFDIFFYNNFVLNKTQECLKLENSVNVKIKNNIFVGRITAEDIDEHLEIRNVEITGNTFHKNLDGTSTAIYYTSLDNGNILVNNNIFDSTNVYFEYNTNLDERGLQIKNNIFSDCESYYPIKILGNGDITIEGNQILNAAHYAMLVESDSVGYFTLRNNYFKANGVYYGVWLIGINKGEISNNYIETPNTIGLFLNNVKNTILYKNRIENCGSNGCVVTGTSDSLVFSGNWFINNKYDGLEIRNGNYIVVAGKNWFVNNRYYGIGIQNTPSIEEWGNFYLNNGSGDIESGFTYLPMTGQKLQFEDIQSTDDMTVNDDLTVNGEIFTGNLRINTYYIKNSTGLTERANTNIVNTIDNDENSTDAYFDVRKDDGTNDNNDVLVRFWETGNVVVGGADSTAGAIMSFPRTDKFFLFPKLTTTQRDALSPISGAVIYNTTIDSMQYYNGSTWINMGN